MPKEEIMKDVKDSPLFNMSLSNKELFHSNLISWVFTEYPAIMKTFLKIDDEFEKYKVNREYHNFDLSVHTDKKVYIIENKVKSIPSIEQLEGYKLKASRLEKNKEKQLFLLSFYGDGFEGDNQGWSWLSYIDLVKAIKNYLPIENKYHQYLLEDYCDLIEKINYFYGSFLPKNEKELLYDNDMVGCARDLRIADMYYKFRLAKVSSMVLEKMRMKGLNVVKGKLPADDLDKDQILLDINMTNGTGLIEVKSVIPHPSGSLVFGVQVQNFDFRLFILSDNHKLVDSIVNRVNYSDIWFDFSELEKLFPSSHKIQKKDFCTFATKDYNMKYKYMRCDDLTIDGLSELFITYMRKLTVMKSNNQNIL